MLYSFRIDAPGLDGAVFLVERATLPAAGDLEAAFLAEAGQIERHRGAVGHVAVRLAAEPGTEVLVLVRNSGLVLDERLAARIAAARSRLCALSGRWSLAAAGGLTPTGERVSALYASASPHLPLHPAPRPLVDPLPDLCLVDAAWLAERAARAPALPDTAFETILVTEGYLDRRVALYAPELVGGIDGSLRARDPLRLRAELQDRFAPTIPGEDIPTLTGPISIDPAAAEGNRPPVPAAGLLAEAVEETVDALCDPLSLSIVTRTRFDRPHLLERLLASITRARRDSAEIEVVLSSDAPRETCETALADLRARFVNLALRLRHNPPGTHSRVDNLIGGLRAAAGEYVAVVDDDDYVDLFAFAEMQRALFLGARPLMATASAVHDETWTETPSGCHVLTRSAERATYPAAGWRRLFGGVNRLPVCALVMPRARLQARLDAFVFEHDLSEDYALHLLTLTDPALPEIVELPGVFCHISHRPGDGHSMTLEDRRPWARDIALYLAGLTRTAAAAGPGQWLLHAGRETADTAIEAQNAAELQDAVSARDRQIRLMRLEMARLCEAAPEPAPGRRAREAAA